MVNLADGIRTEHREMVEALARASSENEPVVAGTIVNDFYDQFSNYRRFAESTLYPWLLRRGLGQSYIDVSAEELDALDVLAKRLAEAPADDGHFEARVLAMKRFLETHLEAQDGAILGFVENAPDSPEDPFPASSHSGRNSRDGEDERI